MLALRAKIEGGGALISRPGFSEFLFFRYVNTILGSKSQFIVWFPRDRNKPGLCRMSELTMTAFSAIQIPAIILQHLNDHVEGFIIPADEKRARVGWIAPRIHREEEMVNARSDPPYGPCMRHYPKKHENPPKRGFFL